MGCWSQTCQNLTAFTQYHTSGTSYQTFFVLNGRCNRTALSVTVHRYLFEIQPYGLNQYTTLLCYLFFLSFLPSLPDFNTFCENEKSSFPINILLPFTFYFPLLFQGWANAKASITKSKPGTFKDKLAKLAKVRISFKIDLTCILLWMSSFHGFQENVGRIL